MFEPNLIGNSKDRFSLDDAHISQKRYAKSLPLQLVSRCLDIIFRQKHQPNGKKVMGKFQEHRRVREGLVHDSLNLVKTLAKSFSRVIDIPLIQGEQRRQVLVVNFFIFF